MYPNCIKFILITGSSLANDFQVDFDLIIHNIQDLNALAGEGVGQIHHTTDGARLKVY